MNPSNFSKYKVPSGPYSYEGLWGKNTGGLLSEASIGHKKIGIAVCASLNWTNPSKQGEKTWFPQHLYVCTDRALHNFKELHKDMYPPFSQITTPSKPGVKDAEK